MIPYIGDFAEDVTIYHYFNTFDSNDPSQSVTITDLILTDLFVYKDGNTTDIVTDGATVDIDFDARTGIHKITIDTSADAAYAIGSDYMVSMVGTTVDAGTITAALFTFSIENRYNAAADDLANGTDGLGAIKAETALILADTGELQTDDTPTSIAALQTDLDTLTAGVTLAAGAITNASLAGNMEIVFETDFATNYNTTRNAWVTNYTDIIGSSGFATTTELDKVPKSDGTVSWNATALASINTQVDTSMVTYGLDHLISAALPTNWATDVISGSVFDNIADDGTAAYDRTTDSLQAVRDHATTIKDETALIVADTAELQTDDIPTLIAAVQSDTDDIQTRLPAALSSGNMKSDVLAISTSTAAADNLEASALTIVPAVCEGSPTTSVIQTDLAETTDDHYIGRVAIFIDGAGAYQASDIVDYVGSTGTITVTTMTTAPSSGDALVII